jgi:hypothetical protein
MAFSRGVPLGEYGQDDPNSIPLGTRESRHIPNQKRNEWAPDDLKEAVSACMADFPMIQVRSVTAVYNCVGMVFASRRTWVDTDFVRQLLTEDGYALVQNRHTSMVGDVVIYENDEHVIKHVGIIIQKSEDLTGGHVTFKILSKWGPWAEFIHDEGHIYDAWGKFSEVWTDRKCV